MAGAVVVEQVAEQVAKKKIKLKEMIVSENENINNDELVIERVYKLTFSHYFIISSLISLSIMFIIVCIIFPNNLFGIESNEGFIIEFWCIVPLYGFCFGFAYLSQELIVIELIPSYNVGSLIGIKMFIEYLARGFIVLIIAIFWHYTYNAFFYTQAAFVAIVFLFVFIIALLETLTKHKF